MRQVVCDQCLRIINPRSAGFTSITVRRTDTELVVDVCSPACHRAWVHFYEFAATHRLLAEEHAPVSQLPVPDGQATRSADELAAQERWAYDGEYGTKVTS